MNFDKTKRIFAEIEESPGILPAQIIFNQLIENDFKVWIIGNIQGNVIFTVNLNNGHKVITGFTDKDICISYINRKDVIGNIKAAFGRRLITVNMSILKLDMIMKNMSEINTIFNIQSIKQNVINNIILNPNSIDFFVPVNIPTVANFMRTSGREDDMLEGSEAIQICYNKELRIYEESNEELAHIME